MLNHMGQSFQGAKYDNRYMFKISIIECICCVATATSYLQCIMHQIHLHSDFLGETVRLMLAVQPVQEMLSALSLGSSEALGKGLTPFLLSLTENKTNI